MNTKSAKELLAQADRLMRQNRAPEELPVLTDLVLEPVAGTPPPERAFDDPIDYDLLPPAPERLPGSDAFEPTRPGQRRYVDLSAPITGIPANHRFAPLEPTPVSRPEAHARIDEPTVTGGAPTTLPSIPPSTTPAPPAPAGAVISRASNPAPVVKTSTAAPAPNPAPVVTTSTEPAPPPAPKPAPLATEAAIAAATAAAAARAEAARAVKAAPAMAPAPTPTPATAAPAAAASAPSAQDAAALKTLLDQELVDLRHELFSEAMHQLEQQAHGALKRELRLALQHELERGIEKVAAQCAEVVMHRVRTVVAAAVDAEVERLRERLERQSRT